jgi:sulfur carrier protein
MSEGRQITVNGEAKQVAATSVAELLSELGMTGAFVAVAVNRDCVPRATFGSTPLRSGDEVEILAPMAGG